MDKLINHKTDPVLRLMNEELDEIIDQFIWEGSVDS